MKAIKIILSLLLFAGASFMAYLCYNSVVTPIKFDNTRAAREVKVINHLVNLRLAQEEFRLAKGHFTADLDSLVDYLKVAPKKEVYKEKSLSEKQLEKGLTEEKIGKILKRARAKAQNKMHFQGPDSLVQIYNYIWANDAEVKANGLQGFRRDTIMSDMITALYKGQYTKENIKDLTYIPFTDGVRFEVETNNEYKTSQGIRVPIFEIRAPFTTYLHDLDAQELTNLIDKETELEHYTGLKVGSVEAPNNNAGNWE
jgi:hypothetical protein